MVVSNRSEAKLDQSSGDGSELVVRVLCDARDYSHVNFVRALYLMAYGILVMAMLFADAPLMRVISYNNALSPNGRQAILGLRWTFLLGAAAYTLISIGHAWVAWKQSREARSLWRTYEVQYPISRAQGKRSRRTRISLDYRSGS